MLPWLVTRDLGSVSDEEQMRNVPPSSDYFLHGRAAASRLQARLRDHQVRPITKSRVDGRGFAGYQIVTHYFGVQKSGGHK
jgi:hypothetical protein